MIVKDNKIDALNIELTLVIGKDDYAETEKKKLSQIRKTAEFKGFRKGMVPESLVRRVYGGQVLVDAVNECISKGIDDYVKAGNLNLLGEPISSEKQPELTWEDGSEFTFVFDLALNPEVNVELSSDDTVNSYTITVAEKDKAPMIENLKKFYADKKEEKSDEDIDKEVSERMKSEYAQESEWRLSKDIREYFVKKADIALPESFLKRWLLNANEGKVTAEDVEKEFPAFLEDYRWQLVRSAIVKKYELKIEDKDLQEAAEAYVAYQYAMYGVGNVPAEMIKEAAGNILSDRKQLSNLIEHVEDQKVFAKIKETITIKSKKISAEKFRAL